jgi:hypothetical protein
MNTDPPEITGDTKVATLLDSYPELEETLIAMAHPFKKLRNPILRRSVAKVASLRQAAQVGRLPVAEMVNALRSAIGQNPIQDATGDESGDYFGIQPDWFDESRIVTTMDEKNDFEESRMPVISILQRCNDLRDGEILEVRTSFLPVPGIDLMRAKGFLSWSVESAEDDVLTYLAKAEN